MADVRMSDLVRFGPFKLDLATADLHQNGGKIRLPEQQFRVLEMLLRGEGRLVQREEIRKRLWPNDTVVDFDRSINAAIKKLRAALEDSAEEPRFIETVARRGYRIMVEVHFPETNAPPDTHRNVVAGSLIGQRVSHYRVLSLLGGGGMGLVYKAEDLKLDRPVALKFLPEEMASDSLAIQRFEREAKAASALNHPNICTIHGVEEHGTQPFIVMEFLEGESLRELISKYAAPDGKSSFPIPLDRILEIAVQIAEGLKAAHEKGIIHRDIKPANVFVTTRGQVKILDFGLAKVAQTASEIGSDPDRTVDNSVADPGRRPEFPGDHLLTRTGITMGTAAYMSPEQVRGEKLDARTDLFSFGLILFEMATGQRAFDGESAAVVHDAILHRTVPPVRELNPTTPAKVEETTRKALEKDRELRYQRAAEMLADLNRVLKTIQTVSPPATIERSPLPAVRPTLRTALFIGWGALLLVAAVGFLWWKYSRPSPPTEIKERQLTNSSSDNPISGAAISGDGKYLAFDDNSGIHVRSLENGETRDIPNPAQFGDAHVSWTIQWFPDSTRFLAVSHPFGDVNHVITWEASVMGDELRKLREEVEAWAVSPDGSSIAATVADEHELWRKRQLWVMDSDGGNPRKLLDAGDLGYLEGVRWSPDGTKLIYLRHDKNGDWRCIEILDAKSGHSHVVLSNPLLRELYWLRDGRAVYALAEDSGEGTCNYWVAPIDQKTGAFSSEPRQLTHISGFCVQSTSATTDSKKLVFSKRAYTGAVYVADVEAGGTRITPPRHLSLIEGMEQPNGWTPDGREVVFTSNREGRSGVYRQPLSGGPARPVLVEKTQEWFGFPRPSPDGGWLLIERFTPGTVRWSHHDLLRVPMTGGPEELIARDIDSWPSCAAPSIPLCAYSRKEKNELIFTSFDPQLKEKRELGRFTFIDPKGSYAWGLSPEATRIAILQIATGNLYILNLKTQILQRIILKHWNNFIAMDWSADGKGLFMTSLQPGAVLLHVDLHGNAHVLWEPHGEHLIYALPSPDGKHVAMPFFGANINVWMMENF